jgi:hypothetical protein
VPQWRLAVVPRRQHWLRTGEQTGLSNSHGLFHGAEMLLSLKGDHSYSPKAI